MKTSLSTMFWVFAFVCSNATGQTSAAYTVKPGDSLARIARQHGCTAKELAAANGMKLDSVIHPGQALKLPSRGRSPAAVPPATATRGSHTIQPGETLSAISRRYQITLDSLMAANPGIKPNALKVGHKIQLPAARETHSVASASPVSPPPPETKNTPPVAQETAALPAPASTQDTPRDTAENESKIRTVMVDSEITYGEFAAKHGTDTLRLNDLNGLDLSHSTVLAKGSELYVQAKP